MHPHSKDEILWGILHNMRMVLDLFLGVKSCYSLIFGSLWHFITKCDSYIDAKSSKSLLLNASILLQNGTVITKCDVYYKMRRYIGWLLFLNFALKTYGTLKMFLLNTENNFVTIFSSCVEGHVKKNSIMNFMSSVGFQASKNWIFIWKM